MKKRNLIIVSIIIVILALIAGIVIYINSNKLPTEPLNETEIVELLGKAIEIDNIYIRTVIESKQGWLHETIKYQKDGISLTISPNENNTIINWENNSAKEYIQIEEGDKIWYNISEDETPNNQYKFIKYEKYNNSKCAVVDIIIIDDSIEENNMIVRTWIDLKLGVTLKSEYKDSSGDEYVSYSTVELNKVKDEDVQKPNLEGYTEYKYEENT